MTQSTTGGPGTALEQVAPAPGIAKYDAELASLFEQYAGQGAEEMTQADRTTPFLSVLQGLSPQLKPTHAKYLPNARLGEIFNSVTGETFPAGITVVPVLFQHVWNLWIDRDEGGGLLGSYKDKEMTQPILVTNAGAEGTDKTTVLTETVNWWVLAQSLDGTWLPAVISMKGTALGASKKWGTLTTIAANKYAPRVGTTAPLFARAYKLTSVPQTNAKGEFYNWKAEDVGFATPALISTAAELLSMIRAGLLKADPTKAGDDQPAEVETTATATEAKTPGKRPKF
jgi:hypothetical protein